MSKAREKYDKKLEALLYRDYKPYNLARGEDSFGVQFYGLDRAVHGGIKLNSKTKTLLYRGSSRSGFWNNLVTDVTVEEMLELIDALVLGVEDMIEQDGTK